MLIGSLFSGIGGLELGLERAGLGQVVWQCEIDPFCRAVLAKHWPTVERFEDVTSPRDWPAVDLICGGFPCQDVSSAGARAGLAGPKSGLWYHYASIVEKVRPRFVVVENVSSGTKLWLPSVRHHLHMLGYGTRAIALSAADVGAPHLRRRVFVVADAHGESELARAFDAEVAGAPASAPDADGDGVRVESGRRGGSDRGRAPKSEHTRWRHAAPAMVRVVHGLPRRVDRARRRALGNAVVPACAEVVGRVILAMLQPSENTKP